MLGCVCVCVWWQYLGQIFWRAKMREPQHRSCSRWRSWMALAVKFHFLKREDGQEGGVYSLISFLQYCLRFWTMTRLGYYFSTCWVSIQRCWVMTSGFFHFFLLICIQTLYSCSCMSCTSSSHVGFWSSDGPQLSSSRACILLRFCHFLSSPWTLLTQCVRHAERTKAPLLWHQNHMFSLKGAR